MSTLNLIITTAGQAALAQAGTLGPVVISKVAIGSGTWTTAPTASATALKTQIKQLDPSGSSTPSAGIIHITATDGGTDAYNVYEMALYTSTGVLFAIAGGTTLFLTKATSSSALFSIDLAITNVPSGDLVIGDTGFAYPPATETVQGVAEIATTAEALAGVDDVRLITPKKLASYFASNGAGIATGLALASTDRLDIPYAQWSRTSGDTNYTWSATWYLTTGKTFYTETFYVPLGEVWEVECFIPLYWLGDDGFYFAWLKDGAFADGPVDTSYTPLQPTAGTYIPNSYKVTFSSGTHSVALKAGVFSGSGVDVICIASSLTSYRVVRKYSGSATSNQVLTGYALSSVDKSTQTIADWPRSGDSRIATWTSTWYSTAQNVIFSDSITVPVGQVWDVEWDVPIEMQSNDQYSTAWLLNGTPDSNTLLQTWLSANYQNAGFIPNQYKATLSAGTHTIAFKFCIFGGSGTDLARFQFNNRVIRKYSSAATSAGVVSKTTNGYCIMPNGLIMQWGASTGNGVTVVFPIPFSNSCLQVFTNLLLTGNNGTVTYSSVKVGTVTNSNFVALIDSDNSAFNWFAIGY